MSEKEVEQILGMPDCIDTGAEFFYYYYFTKSKSGMRSQMPVVWFDSNKIVVFNTCGRDLPVNDTSEKL